MTASPDARESIRAYAFPGLLLSLYQRMGIRLTRVGSNDS